MSRIHVASGVGTGPTDLASYDAALAAANLHNYNLVAVSSVVPAAAEVVRVDHAPGLGPAGNRLFVVQAVTTVETGRAVAGLGWATGPGPGLFYEAHGESVPDVRGTLDAGLDAGTTLRDWSLPDRAFAFADTADVTESVDRDAFTTAVVVAAFGESEPIC